MRSREDETYCALVHNNYVNTDTILYEIAMSLGRIADMLSEMSGHDVQYDSENMGGENDE